MEESFTCKFISIGVVLPLFLLLGIQQSVYLLEVPQQAVVRHIEAETLKKDPQKVLEHKKQGMNGNEHTSVSL